MSTAELPLFYRDQFDPSNNVYWICDKDDKDQIVSIFIGHGERYTAILPTMDDVHNQESQLKAVGWIKCKKPEITITIDEKTLPRKLKRKEQRKKEKEAKKAQIKEAKLAYITHKNPNVNVEEVKNALSAADAEGGEGDSSSSDEE
jgi:hypothetical protein